MDMGNPAWLTPPVQLHSSREFACDGFTEEQCSYYRQRWHFWYEADHVFALPTVAFFMCTIGIFIIGHVISQASSYRTTNGSPLWRRSVAAVRYLSYRGFHVRALRWNSAPVGLLLLATIGTVYFFCMDLIPQPYYWSSADYGGSPPLATRSGWMALACMPFIFATASKTNWITLLTGVTHEKLQVFHRWTSYAFFVLALLHTFPFIVYHIRFHDMVEEVTRNSTVFYWTGIVALIFQAWLTFASHSTIRNLGYEFFRATHFFAVIVFILIFFWHCDYALSSWDYFIATAAVYVPCLVYPWLRTLFEYGVGQRAQITIEDNGFTRITIPAKFDWVPGQHCFLRFRSFGIHAFTSHPFTICSLPSISPTEESEITFYIRHRGGFTARLYNYAMRQPGGSVPVLVDGPYGGIDPQRFYGSDRLLVVAGGSGAGWILPFIEQFVRLASFSGKKPEVKSEEIDSHASTSSNEAQRLLNNRGPSSLRVILATRDTATRVWFHQAVRSLLSKYDPLDSAFDLDIQVYLTSEAEQHLGSSKILSDTEGSDDAVSVSKSAPEYHAGVSKKLWRSSVSDSEQYGRPRLPTIVGDEAARVAETEQSLGVFACGPDTMQNDIRNAVAVENLSILKKPRAGGIYLHMEHFSWA